MIIHHQKCPGWTIESYEGFHPPHFVKFFSAAGFLRGVAQAQEMKEDEGRRRKREPKEENLLKWWWHSVLAVERARMFRRERI